MYLKEVCTTHLSHCKRTFESLLVSGPGCSVSQILMTFCAENYTTQSENT